MVWHTNCYYDHVSTDVVCTPHRISEHISCIYQSLHRSSQMLTDLAFSPVLSNVFLTHGIILAQPQDLPSTVGIICPYLLLLRTCVRHNLSPMAPQAGGVREKTEKDLSESQIKACKLRMSEFIRPSVVFTWDMAGHTTRRSTSSMRTAAV